MTPDKLLKSLLWLSATLSFVIGILLTSGTTTIFNFMGFPYHGGFFAVQAGVFYIILSIAFVMTGSNLNKQNLLVWFCIGSKFMLAVFFFMYFLMYEQIRIVLAFGGLELILGALLIQFNSRYRRFSKA